MTQIYVEIQMASGIEIGRQIRFDKQRDNGGKVAKRNPPSPCLPCRNEVMGPNLTNWWTTVLEFEIEIATESEIERQIEDIKLWGHGGR